MRDGKAARKGVAEFLAVDALDFAGAGRVPGADTGDVGGKGDAFSRGAGRKPGGGPEGPPTKRHSAIKRSVGSPPCSGLAVMPYWFST